MSNDDIRWKQRLHNYLRAFAQLKRFIDQGTLNELEEQGLIQAFEFTHELAWNVMKDYFTYQGNVAITGSRDATREAFRANLVSDGEGWMSMIQSRNQTSHTYNQNIAREIATQIRQTYFGLFQAFAKRMQDLADANP